MGIINETYYIWGTGEKARQLNDCYGNQIKAMKIAGYIDNDLTKEGNDFYGKRIYSPEILSADRKAYLIIFNYYKAEIIKQIEKKYPWYVDRIVSERVFINFLMLSHYEKTDDKEIRQILLYLEEHLVSMFNYPFVKKYEKEYEIQFDKQIGLYYVICFGKRMYMKRSYDESYAKFYYKCIQLEQDSMSPHRYMSKKCAVLNHAVVIDGGAAEGYFALSCIEQAKKIYLFEPDKEWLEALEYTFMPYKDKVVIINKCLADYENDYTTTIDKSVQEDTVDFIKMDIEGDEFYALLGARNVMNRSPKLQCAVCTYHQELAYPLIKHLLEDMNFNTEPSHGYVWFNNDINMARNVALRRCLIRGWKESFQMTEE